MTLGLLWLLDGLLQLQPFMFTRGFAEQIIAPAGDGQPAYVSSPVSWAAGMISAHPVLWDSFFAIVQIALGFLILTPRVMRIGLAGSMVWGLGIWLFGEGLGGLASGHADLLTGAPGAALLYVVMAAALWPDHRGRDSIATWLPLAWAGLWMGSALLQLLPAQNSAAALAGDFSGTADGMPTWVTGLNQRLRTAVDAAGAGGLVLIVAPEVWIGVNAFAPARLRRIAGIAGGVVAIVCWFTCQACGDLTTGRATDPGTAPLVVLLAIALTLSARETPGDQW